MDDQMVIYFRQAIQQNLRMQISMGLTAQELTYARNEIYARYGYVFDSKELNDYFATKSWYTVNSAATDDSLSDLEKKNAEFIRIYQENNQLKYDVK